MDVEKYFEAVIEFEKLLCELECASDVEKERINTELLLHPYLKRVRSFQNMCSIEVDEKASSEKLHNNIRDEYFFNSAVPSSKNGKKNGNPIVSGYHEHNYYELLHLRL